MASDDFDRELQELARVMLAEGVIDPLEREASELVAQLEPIFGSSLDDERHADAVQLAVSALRTTAGDELVRLCRLGIMAAMMGGKQ